MKPLFPFLAAVTLCTSTFAADPQFVVYQGKSGPGAGKNVAFISGDEEYRSEEVLPQLAKIFSQHHGFNSAVLFAVNPQTGEIDPNTKDNIPGIEALDKADLVVMMIRFREWPDDQMKHFDDYLKAGKPIIALRTSTHGFKYDKSESPYKKYSFNNKGPEWAGGFGKEVLGETWHGHHGSHKKEATRGIIEPAAKDNPILRGVADIFGTTDVYGAEPPADVHVLVRGQVLAGMNPTDPPVEGKKNDPMQPIVWTREYKNETGKTNKILTITMGAAPDLQNEGLRRLIVNGAYWAVGLEDKIPAKADVSVIGSFPPTMYGPNEFKKGVKPADLK